MSASASICQPPPGAGVVAERAPDALLQKYDTVAMAKSPEGKDFVLQTDKGHYFLYLENELLMTSEQHGSEKTLAELGCAGLREKQSPQVLIGGLGMGFTLRAALDLLGDDAEITTAEFSDIIIEWNSENGPLAAPSGFPLADPRSRVVKGDFGQLVRDAKPGSYDAILIDLDNEPEALGYSGNDFIYSLAGLQAVRTALSPSGVMAFWFVYAPPEFDEILTEAGFCSVRHEVPDGEGHTHLIILSTPRSGDRAAS